MPKILYEKRQKIAYITINNAEKANILDRETSHEISEAWKEVWEDHDVRVAILTGVGERHFCAGHNLAPRPDITEEERERVRAESVFWPLASTVNGAKIGADGRLGDHYPQIWKPVIGAINGWAAGAGFYLMLTSTDIRLACSTHARFKFALLSQGWVGGGPGATYLTRQVSYADAMRILLTDEAFDAQEALRINLINEVVAARTVIEPGGGDCHAHCRDATVGGAYDERVRDPLSRYSYHRGLAGADAHERPVDAAHYRWR